MRHFRFEKFLVFAAFICLPILFQNCGELVKFEDNLNRKAELDSNNEGSQAEEIEVPNQEEPININEVVVVPVEEPSQPEPTLVVEQEQLDEIIEDENSDHEQDEIESEMVNRENNGKSHEEEGEDSEVVAEENEDDDDDEAPRMIGENDEDDDDDDDEAPRMIAENDEDDDDDEAPRVITENDEDDDDDEAPRIIAENDEDDDDDEAPRVITENDEDDDDDEGPQTKVESDDDKDENNRVVAKQDSGEEKTENQEDGEEQQDPNSPNYCPHPNNQGRMNYVCLVNASGWGPKKDRLNINVRTKQVYVDGFRLKYPVTLCMSKNACENLFSTTYSNTKASYRLRCDFRNPLSVYMSDAQVSTLLTNSQQASN